MEEKKIKLIIESDLNNVALIGVSINKLCSLASLSEIESYRIELSVVEIVTNIIRHAYNNEKGRNLEVEFNLTPDRITISTKDSGNEFDMNIKPKLDFDPDDLSTLPDGGMGLYIIYNTMDKVEVKREQGNNIWNLVKYLNKEDRE